MECFLNCVVSHLGLAVLVEDALVVVASGAVQTHLTAGAHVAELPNVEAGDHGILVEDVQALAQMKLYGAIIGKAYYTGAIDLRKAIEVTA